MKNKRLLVILVLILLIGLALTYNGKIIFTKKESKKIDNIGSITQALTIVLYYQEKNKSLPETIEKAVALYPYDKGKIQSILLHKKIKYNPKGYPDKDNRLWIFVLKDDNFPNTFFVGNLNSNKIISQEDLLHNPF